MLEIRRAVVLDRAAFHRPRHRLDDPRTGREIVAHLEFELSDRQVRLVLEQVHRVAGRGPQAHREDCQNRQADENAEIPKQDDGERRSAARAGLGALKRGGGRTG